MVNLEKKDVLMILRYLLGDSCRHHASRKGDHCISFRRVLNAFIDAVPDLAWFRELEIDQAAATDAVKWLQMGNRTHIDATAGQLCL